jgi:two-component system chemotaxis response regulator CheY
MFDIKLRVLVVDDMMTMRKIVVKTLKGIGFTDFIEAADGVKAWDALTNSEVPVGLIVSDWNMPNCTGLEFLKKVRADAKYKPIPFLMLTAEAEGHQVAEAVKSGVSNYVLKPFTPETLTGKLEATHKRLSALKAA